MQVYACIKYNRRTPLDLENSMVWVYFYPCLGALNITGAGPHLVARRRTEIKYEVAVRRVPQQQDACVLNAVRCVRGVLYVPAHQVLFTAQAPI